MTPAEHQQRHLELHRALDELFADYIKNHPCATRFLDRPISDLMEWSYKQTIQPDEDAHAQRDAANGEERKP